MFVSKTIAASPKMIFAVLTDPAKHPVIDGSGSVQRERSGDRTRLGLGSRFSMEMQMGLPYRVTSAVVEFEEGQLIAWSHFARHRWRWQLGPTDDGGTFVTETFDWSSSIAPRFIERRGFPERNREAMVATLDRLEALLSAVTR